MEGFPWGSTVKEFACNAGDLGSIPGLGRFPGGGEIYPLRYRSWMGMLFSRSVMSDSLWTSWTVARQTSWSFTSSQSLLKFMLIELVLLFNHLVLCYPLLLLSSIFPSIRVFSNESALHIKWPKYWSFNFSISLSNKNSRLISFRIDCVDLLAVQETLKSLLQHHS